MTVKTSLRLTLIQQTGKLVCIPKPNDHLLINGYTGAGAIQQMLLELMIQSMTKKLKSTKIVFW